MAAATATETRIVTAEPWSPDAWRPFGEVLTRAGRERLPIDFYGDRADIYNCAMEADEPIEYLISYLRLREMRVVYLERHVNITQAFIPIGGVPYLVAAAPADAPIVDGVPALDSVRAFVVPGDVPLQMNRGIWHEPPFPLQGEQLMLITSHQSLTRGLSQGNRAEVSKLDVDKRNITERTGVELRIALP